MTDLTMGSVAVALLWGFFGMSPWLLAQVIICAPEPKKEGVFFYSLIFLSSVAMTLQGAFGAFCYIAWVNA